MTDIETMRYGGFAQKSPLSGYFLCRPGNFCADVPYRSEACYHDAETAAWVAAVSRRSAVQGGRSREL